MPEVGADVAQIRQLLPNPASNAPDALPGGGSLFGTPSGVDGAALADVRHRGPVIEPARLARIFDPFFTTKERGTGLGLALAQEIAQEHGGELTCASTPGQGTSFTLRLPGIPDERARTRARMIPTARLS